MPKLNFRLHLILLELCVRASAIRNDVLLHPKLCKNTVQGRYLLTDDNGYVCNVLSLDPDSRCCPRRGEQFSCRGCNLVTQCCNSYEYCVSCCLNPSQVKIAKPVIAGTYASVFDFCSGRCRHNSQSVVHENAYISDFHHCFSLPSNSSDIRDAHLEAKLDGISIIIGRHNESCDSVCKLSGKSCVLGKLQILNECGIIQKHMDCKGGCLPSIGSDQPAEVDDDAPKHLHPGACLYTRRHTRLSCYGSHQYTRRLCPCA